MYSSPQLIGYTKRYFSPESKNEKTLKLSQEYQRKNSQPTSPRSYSVSQGDKHHDKTKTLKRTTSFDVLYQCSKKLKRSVSFRSSETTDEGDKQTLSRSSSGLLPWKWAFFKKVPEDDGPLKNAQENPEKMKIPSLWKTNTASAHDDYDTQEHSHFFTKQTDNNALKTVISDFKNMQVMRQSEITPKKSLQKSMNQVRYADKNYSPKMANFLKLEMPTNGHSSPSYSFEKYFQDNEVCQQTVSVRQSIKKICVRKLMNYSMESSVDNRNDLKEKTSSKQGMKKFYKIYQTLTVTLNKGREKKLGFAISGGVDYIPQKVIVCSISPDGQAFENGKLKLKDEIIAVNGMDIDGCTRERIIREIKRNKLNLVLRVKRRKYY